MAGSVGDPVLAHRYPPPEAIAAALGLVLVIELSALLAVMVVLLFILMFADLGPHGSRQIPVDLAMTEHAVPEPGARREDAIQVGVTKDGSVYLNGTRVAPRVCLS